MPSLGSSLQVFFFPCLLSFLAFFLRLYKSKCLRTSLFYIRLRNLLQLQTEEEEISLKSILLSFIFFCCLIERKENLPYPNRGQNFDVVRSQPGKNVENNVVLKFLEPVWPGLWLPSPWSHLGRAFLFLLQENYGFFFSLFFFWLYNHFEKDIHYC